MLSGYVPIRRGILDHVRSGDLTHEETFAYLIIILESDCATGIWWGSAKALGPYNFSHRAARHILEQLHIKGYINRFSKKGRRGNYPVLINKYGVTRGRWAGMKLNANKTLDWREPAYECQVEGQVEGQLTAPSQEGEGKRKRRKKRAAAQPPHPLHGEIRAWCAGEWERRLDQKPPWDGRDSMALRELLQARPDLTLAEVKPVWANYMASSKKFYDDSGWPLWAFCQDYAGLSLHPVHDRGRQGTAPTAKPNGQEASTGKFAAYSRRTA